MNSVPEPLSPAISKNSSLNESDLTEIEDVIDNYLIHRVKKGLPEPTEDEIGTVIEHYAMIRNNAIVYDMLLDGVLMLTTDNNGKIELLEVQNNETMEDMVGEMDANEMFQYTDEEKQLMQEINERNGKLQKILQAKLDKINKDYTEE